MGEAITPPGMSPIDETGKKRISRKLLWWLFGVLVTVCFVLVLVMAMSNGGQQQAADQKKKDDEIANVQKQTAGTADDITRIKADQEQAAKEERERQETADRLRQNQKPAGAAVPEIKMSSQELNQYEQAKNTTPVETTEDIRRDMVVFQQKTDDQQNGTAGGAAYGAASPQTAGVAPGAAGTANGGLITPEQMALRAQTNAAAGQNRSAQFLQAQAAGLAKSGAAGQWSDTIGGTAIKPPLSPVPAVSKYLLSENEPIPAVTTRILNSDLPGKMEARVTRDIYDSIKKEILLIPMGTRLVGPYNSDVIPGQDRVDGGFTRMIFPNGASVPMDASGMADRLGQSGLTGDVNNHFIRQLGLQFTVAGIAKMAKLDNGSSGGSGTNVYAGGNTTSIAGQILTDTVSRYSNRYMNMKPTITVPDATVFNVIVSRDLYLPPAVTVKPNQFAGETE